ncbi:ATP-binding protein [Streptomyces nojiriensis]|uniref:ATP-binding protein n=1 Tax=Streptomyces nojiriensis TaxID=66374 RepID=UPI00365254DC
MGVVFAEALVNQCPGVLVGGNLPVAERPPGRPGDEFNGITSNRAPNDWYPLFPNPVVAESLLDRLIDASHQVIMNGPSYRPNKRPRASA